MTYLTPLFIFITDAGGDLVLEVGINRKVRFVFKHDTDYITAMRRFPPNTVPDMQIEIPLQRWLRFLETESALRDQVQELFRGNNVEAKLHLGGLLYLTLSSRYNCVQFRQHFITQNERKVKASKYGVSMNFLEYYFFLLHVAEFSNSIERLGDLVPCYDRKGHNNRCLECYPVVPGVDPE